MRRWNGGTVRRKMRWCVLGAFVLLVGTACSDSFGVENVLGTWSLTSVNGDPVPGDVTFYAGDMSDIVYVHYVRIILAGGGLCTMESRFEDDEDTIDCTYVLHEDQKAVTVTDAVQQVPMTGPVTGTQMVLSFTVGGASNNWVLNLE